VVLVNIDLDFVLVYVNIHQYSPRLFQRLIVKYFKIADYMNILNDNEIFILYSESPNVSPNKDYGNQPNFGFPKFKQLRPVRKQLNHHSPV
jgi:hypothetical protein